MRKHIGMILAGFFVVCAAGCADAQTQPEEAVRESAGEEQTEELTEEELTEEQQTENAAPETELAAAVGSLSEEEKDAYHSVLYDIYFNHLFPNGREYGFQGDDISENQFAVYDVDQDGSLELLIRYTTTYMAGQVEIVYNFESELDMVREEFIEFPMLTFYDNGYVTAGWSHAQGIEGDFWPYTLYRYDPEGDAYAAVAQVEAWDSDFETDNEGNPFPEEADVSGAGIVYYITPEGEETKGPADQAEYETWLASWQNDAQEMEIPWVSLTEENIGLVKDAAES